MEGANLYSQETKTKRNCVWDRKFPGILNSENEGQAQKIVVQNQLNSRPNLFSHFGVSEMLYIIIKYTFFYSLLQMILFDMSPF